MSCLQIISRSATPENKVWIFLGGGWEETDILALGIRKGPKTINDLYKVLTKDLGSFRIYAYNQLAFTYKKIIVDIFNIYYFEKILIYVLIIPCHFYIFWYWGGDRKKGVQYIRENEKYNLKQAQNTKKLGLYFHFKKESK